MRNLSDIKIPKDIDSFLSEIKEANDNFVEPVFKQIIRIGTLAKILIPGEYVRSIGTDYEIIFERNFDGACLTVLDHNTQEVAMEFMECTFATDYNTVSTWVFVMLRAYLLNKGIT